MRSQGFLVKMKLGDLQKKQNKCLNTELNNERTKKPNSKSLKFFQVKTIIS